MDIRETLYSDTYEIDPIALIPVNKYDALKDLYGHDWKIIIRNKFKEIDHEVHFQAENKFGKLYAPTTASEYYAAGLADLIPFGHKKISKK